MNSKITFYLLIAGLIISGLCLAWHRHAYLKVPFIPGTEKSVWLVEARIDFTASANPVRVSLDLPDHPPGFRQVSEQAASTGYGFSILENAEGRRAEWTKRNTKGRQTIYYKIQMIEDPDEKSSKIINKNPKAQKVYWDLLQTVAAHQIIDQAYEKSSTPASFARELSRILTSPEPDQNASLLLSEYNIVHLLMRLINHAGIPARISMGLELEDARRYQPLKPVIEIFQENQWTAIDPKTGILGLPDNILLWHREGRSILDVTGGKDSEIRFSMLKQTLPAMDLARLQFNDRISRLNLYSLPIEEQSVFKLLLLLPVGALIVTFMRIIIGIRTSGTFMPVLIALSFLQTQLIQGITAFVSIVVLGLMLRGYLSKLNLLMVARISTLIVLVIFLTSVISVIGYELGFQLGLTLTFFPMIIIAWTIERMSILWEEEGSREVFIQGLGSLCVAIIAYVCMNMDIIRHLTFNFPEIHLIILAFILMMGQYTGYKLTELHRFGVIKKDF
ncbi:MAG: inactive transglutaminase family protein [Desulfobacteraceae bacterium]|nr:inactive transglutaminase family protein [Desulfobacteraceae bacterium]MCB9494789.1 inactive transglutaminase family protein [Desulfobacteraceae bacterium]